jgi:hypothetical protein
MASGAVHACRRHGLLLAGTSAAALLARRFYSDAYTGAKAYDADPTTLFSGYYELNPYITFQLDAAYSSLYGVMLWGRADGLATQQFKNYTLSISSSPTLGSGTVCATGLTIVSNNKLRLDVPCPAQSGVQYVTVSKSGTGVVSLGEVQVMIGRWPARGTHMAKACIQRCGVVALVPMGAPRRACCGVHHVR